MIEEFHEYLRNDDFTVFYCFGLMAVEPTLPQKFRLTDFQVTFVIILHNVHHLTHHRKSFVKQLLYVPQLDLDNVFGVLGEGCTPNLLSPKNLHNYLFTRINSDFFEYLVHFLGFVGIDFFRSGSKSHEAIGVDSDHVFVGFVIVFSPRKEILVDRYPFHDLFGLLIHDEE